MFIEKTISTTVQELNHSFTKKLKLVPGKSDTMVLDDTEKSILSTKVSSRKRPMSEAESLLYERNRTDKMNRQIDNAVEEQALILDFSSYKLISYLFRPQKQLPHSPMILYVHGGGFTAGKIDYYRNQCKRLAEYAQHNVLFIEYRLAPENCFPSPIDDLVHTIDYVLNASEVFQVSDKQVILVGDSAGGSIINGTVLRQPKEKIAMVVELYSVTDIDIIGNQTYDWNFSMFPVADDQKQLVYDRLERFKNLPAQLVSYYLGNQNKAVKDPLVSINYATDAQLQRFPKTLLIEAEFDFFRVGMDIFAARLAQNHVDLSVIEYCGCDHGFLDHLDTLPQAQDVLKVIGTAIRSL
ncbi:MAG: alpha/beta hydrolase fold domain-containing protein [Sporolactobacillus sp.]